MICLDMYLTFLVPMVQLASVVLGIAGLVLTLLGSGITFGGIMLHGMMLAALMTAGGFVASVVGSAVFAAFTVALKNESLSGMAKGILAYWVFLMSQMVLTLLSFVKKQENGNPSRIPAQSGWRTCAPPETGGGRLRPSRWAFIAEQTMEKRGTRPLAVSVSDRQKCKEGKEASGKSLKKVENPFFIKITRAVRTERGRRLFVGSLAEKRCFSPS
ncbi:MAG: hypothetical protein ACLRZH_07690 [Ruthenibacterium lactatiformans]